MVDKLDREKQVAECFSDAVANGHTMVLGDINKARKAMEGGLRPGVRCGEYWICAHGGCRAFVLIYHSDGSNPTRGPEGNIVGNARNGEVYFACGIQHDNETLRNPTHRYVDDTSTTH